jgi:hypothetical protein
MKDAIKRGKERVCKIFQLTKNELKPTSSTETLILGQVMIVINCITRKVSHVLL